MSFLQKDLIFLRITPGAAQTKIVGKFVDEKNQEYLKISVAAQPEDGKANEELIKFLSKKLKIPKSKIEIIRGEAARIKVLKLQTPDSDPMAFLDRVHLLLRSKPS